MSFLLPAYVSDTDDDLILFKLMIFVQILHTDTSIYFNVGLLTYIVFYRYMHISLDTLANQRGGIV